MPTKSRTIREHSAKPLRKHGLTRCPDCGVKLAWPYDERCDWCDCPFWPSAGHYSAQEAEKRAAKGKTNGNK